MALDVCDFTNLSKRLSSQSLHKISDCGQQNSTALELKDTYQKVQADNVILFLGQLVDERRDKRPYGWVSNEHYSPGERWNIGVIALSGASVGRYNAWRRVESFPLGQTGVRKDVGASVLESDATR